MGVLHNGQLRCGGTLITDSLVVTAGHCADFPNSELFSVLAGSISLDDQDVNAQSFEVFWEIFHRACELFIAE